MPLLQPTRSEVSEFEDQYGALANFLACWFPENDLDGIEDDEAARRFAEVSSPEEIDRVITEGEDALRDYPIGWREAAYLANRPFGGADEAEGWLRHMLAVIKRELVER